MAISNPLRHLLCVLALAPIACTFPVKSGDNPLAETTGEPDPDTTGEPSTDSPTTAAPPDDDTCGDGEVRGDERCDDGNDDPHDGCDMTCQRSGTEEWIVHPDGLTFVSALAVSATTGQIVIVGDDLMTAIDPDGVELWRKTVGPVVLDAVEIDDQGTIYAASQTGSIHALTADGDELWNIDAGDSIRALALGHGALYSVDLDAESNSHFILRQHDRSTGAVVWSSVSPDSNVSYGGALAVVGPHVVVAGVGYKPGQPADGNLHRLLAVYDDAGALQSLEVGDEDNSEWAGAAATSDGGFALVGAGPMTDIVVGRFGADLAPQWTVYDESGPGTVANAVAAGPAGTIAIGVYKSEEKIGLIRRLDAAGATMWTSQYPAGPDHYASAPTAIEFGPGFIVATGSDNVNTSSNVWVRRFADE